MSLKISRRKALAAGAVSAGLLVGSPSPKAYAGQLLAPVWGEDFLTPWSPPENLKRDLTPGPTPIRLSCSSYGIRNTAGGGGGGGAAGAAGATGARGTPAPDSTTAKPAPVLLPFGDQVKAVRDAGYTACESSSSDWTKTPDSQIRELQAALKQYDVLFYGIHIVTNIIAPDTAAAEANKQRIVTGIESAERIGREFILMHTGGRNPKSKDRPHIDNWTRATWEMSVNAVKDILKRTSGSKVNLAFEAVNCCNNNTPQSHMRLRQDVGDPRVKVMFDPTNMMHPGVFFRTTELLNLMFDLAGEDIMYCHAKDSTWNSMSTAINEGAVLGTGNLDYETFLVRMSRMKYPRALLIEHLSADLYPACKKFLEETAAKVGVKIYS